MRRGAMLTGGLLRGGLLAALLTGGAFASVVASSPADSTHASLFAAGALSSLTVASSPAASSTVYVENQYQPTRLAIKPHGYYDNTSVHNLVWSDWGQATTTARGTFTFQFCVEESCSVSPFYDEPVIVTLSGIQRCHARLTYTTLALDVEATLPDSSFKGYRTSVGVCAKSHPSARRRHG
jgi:hypothetical protein